MKKLLILLLLLVSFPSCSLVGLSAGDGCSSFVSKEAALIDAKEKIYSYFYVQNKVSQNHYECRKRLLLDVMEENFESKKYDVVVVSFFNSETGSLTLFEIQFSKKLMVGQQISPSKDGYEGNIEVQFPLQVVYQQYLHPDLPLRIYSLQARALYTKEGFLGLLEKLSNGKFKPNL